MPIETIEHAKWQAELRADRAIIEQVGVYISSESDVQGFQLTEDEA